MKPPSQIERPAPRLQICPVCKQPTHLGCDHAVVEFKADLREKQRQANRASYEKKSKENKEGRNPTDVENTRESGNGSEVPKLNAVGKPYSESYNPNYKPKHTPPSISRLYAPQHGRVPFKEDGNGQVIEARESGNGAVPLLEQPDLLEASADGTEPSQAEIFADLCLLWTAATETTRNKFLERIET
jgi:hypothetical protein